MSAGARAQTAALLSYAAAAAWVLRGAWGRAVGEGVDLPGTLWYHAWVADSLRHLRWPAWTPWFFHPDGKDIFAHTGANLLDALLAAPFLWGFGSPAHMAPFVAVVLVGNGLALRALLRAVGVGAAGALAGGLAFVLAPALLAELDGGRVTQVLLWFWPLALRELWLDRADPRPARLVRAGLLVALQAYTYWFTGHFFAVVFALPLLLVARPARLVGAGLVAAIAVAPAVLPMVRGLADGTVPAGVGLTRAPPDALSPDAWWLLAPGRSQLHVPTLALALAGVGLLFARHRRFWGLAALLGVLLVAGAQLRFAGGLSLPNPAWELASLLPGFERLLFPARAWSTLALVSAAVVGEAVDRLGRAGLVGVVGVGAALLAARPAPLLATPVEVPAYVAAVAAAPGPVLDLPVPCGQLVIHLQPLHGQPMLGGMAEHIPGLVPDTVEARWVSPALAPLVDAGLGKPARAALSGDPGARWVVLHEDVFASPLARVCLRGAAVAPGAPRRELERLLGPPTLADGNAVAWDLAARPR